MMTHAQKTKVVESLQSKLHIPTEKQLHFMHDRAVPHQIYYSSPKRLWCTNCGHRFSIGREIPNKWDEKETCPHCGMRFPVCHTNKMRCDEDGYAMIAQVVGDWQILRYFYLENHNYINGYVFPSTAKYTYGPSKEHTEVLRIWINTQTKDTIKQSLRIGSFPNWRRQPYSLDNHKLQVCSKFAEQSDWRTEWMIKKVVPGAQIHPYYRKRGVNARNINALWTDQYMSAVDRIPYAETLLKMGQIRLANLFASGDTAVQSYQQQIQIALRHGFNFEKFNGKIRDYWDYIRDLRYLGMDDTNPKFLAPANFAKAHEEISERATIQRDREYALARARRQAEEAERRTKEEKRLAGLLEERKERFGSLEIIGYGLIIKPLFTAKDYIEEGKAMHHCVGGYWDKFSSLILSARKDDGERVETIEVSLRTWDVIQSRAVCNGKSAQHDEILQLMKKNMPTIKRLATAS